MTDTFKSKLDFVWAENYVNTGPIITDHTKKKNWQKKNDNIADKSVKN